MDIATATPATSRMTPQQQQKMRDAATDFEAFYITQFINLMKPEHAPSEFNGGVGERMFREELNVQLGKKIASGGGFGIGDKVYAELLRQQEGSQSAPRLPQQTYSTNVQ